MNSSYSSASEVTLENVRDVLRLVSRMGHSQAEAMAVLRRHANVSIETSGVYRQDFLLDVATELGAERVLFGSNSPRMDPRLEVQRVRWAKLAKADKARILDGNARAVFRPGASAPRS